MTTELKWLALSAIFTTLMWLPYILNLIAVRGLMDAMGYPQNPQPMAAWAQRLKFAHYNAVENLVPFAVLVLVAHVSNVHSSLTVLACIVYFWARLVYTIIYTAGIPVVRTIVFAISWLCILTMAAAILM